MKIRDYIGVSKKQQKQVSRGLQLLLVFAVVGGLYLRNMGIFVNSLVSLLITFLPGILERDYEISMDPALVLWITSAVFFHAIGTYGPYQQVWWWDHFTHMLSSSVVALGGYAAVRAFDEYYEGIEMPKKFTFFFVLFFVMAFGVLWEVLEFAISGTAQILGMKTVLTQYGLEDTMKDLIFDTVGGILVAVFGEIYVLNLVDDLKAKIESRDF